MPYVTSWERIGMEKGREQGIREGQQQLLVRLIRARFGEDLAAEGEESLARVKEATQLAQVGDWLVQCATGAELLQRLREVAAPPGRETATRSKTRRPSAHRPGRMRRAAGAKSK